MVKTNNDVATVYDVAIKQFPINYYLFPVFSSTDYVTLDDVRNPAHLERTRKWTEDLRKRLESRRKDAKKDYILSSCGEDIALAKYVFEGMGEVCFPASRRYTRVTINPDKIQDYNTPEISLLEGIISLSDLPVAIFGDVSSKNLKNPKLLPGEYKREQLVETLKKYIP